MATACVTKTLVVAVLCFTQHVVFAHGSVISFLSSPDDVKQGLTKTLTLNCSLADSAPSTSIIGKRDVTHTTDNVLQLTSLVVTKNGHDVASVNTVQAPHVMDGSANVKVSGNVIGNSGTTGFIQLTITNPTVDQTGEFSCEANAMSVSGHGVKFSTTVKVTSSTPSIADLVDAVNQLRNKDGDLEQTVSQLKNRSDTMVFFNAGINGTSHFTPDQVVVFDNIRDNKGSNYNGVTGLFTCTVPGYYHFSLGCMSLADKGITLTLQHNGNFEFFIYGAGGHGPQSGANAVTLQLSRGDLVNVRSGYLSEIQGHFCSFSGHLIEAL